MNFDFNIIQLIKETRYLQRLGFEIPEPLTNICLKETYYRNLFSSLSALLTSKKDILGMEKIYNYLGRVSPTILKAMSCHISELDKTLQPGLTSLTWYFSFDSYY